MSTLYAGNQTSAMEFILLGFYKIKQGKSFFLIFFFIVYTVCFLGNSLILTVILLNQSLHTPMYFFLSNLSFLDICYLSVTVPKMITDILQVQPPSISFIGCAAQVYFLISLESAEGFLLASMALDRYIAICRPLVYSTLMKKRTCLQLAAVSWTCGFLNASVHIPLTFRLSFCRSNRINHFFCDIPPLLSITCSDISINQAVIYTLGIFAGLSPCLFILASYAFILHAILSNRQTKRHQKAISTCVSHLTVVFLFYFSGVFAYFHPASGYSLDSNQLVGVLYNTLTPTLNPLIYSLRNTEVKMAMKKLVHGRTFSFGI